MCVWESVSVGMCVCVCVCVYKYLSLRYLHAPSFRFTPYKSRSLYISDFCSLSSAEFQAMTL